MNNKNIFLSFFMVVGLVSSEARALHPRDEQGRTQLMNFVINKEQELKCIKADLDHLWHTCYHYVQINDGYITEQINNRQSIAKPIYKQKLERRPSCTDADIYALKQREQDERNFLDQTIRTIRFMDQSEDLYINAIDYNGYTVQNYCYTYEIYQELRRLGASFQYIPFMYFNPVFWTAITAGVAITAYMAIGATARCAIDGYKYSVN